MGDEVQDSHYHKRDYVRYNQQLRDEYQLLCEWFDQRIFAEEEAMGGFEQEAWLVDHDMRAAPRNQIILNDANDAFLSPELAKFNLECNVTPQRLASDGLKKMHRELDQRLRQTQRVAERYDTNVLSIGILPTLRDEELTLDNMSTMNRYRALNEQVMRSRAGVPVKLDIVGNQRLSSVHTNVMLEAATTSFQIHRQVPMQNSVRYFNASMIASAATVAVSANSPYVFGVDCWDETRVPVFEQAVAVGGFGDAAHGPVRRVTFGSAYVESSLLECFTENVQHFPILLPVEIDKPRERLPYLRLHNGTIWRWNRPLIGFNDDGAPHLRVEHRVMAAGPTLLDEIADAAFYFGLLESLAIQHPAPERLLEFSRTKDNFYRAAQHGLQCSIEWLDGRRHAMTELIRNELLPLARAGLNRLQMRASDIDDYLEIILARVATARNGAHWQRAYIKKHGRDFHNMTKRYLELQNSGKPVHEWAISE